MQMIQKGGARLVVGFGVTGASVAQHQLSLGYLVMAADENETPTGAALMQGIEHTDLFETMFGKPFRDLYTNSAALNAFLEDFSEVVVSPGIPSDHPVIEAATQLDIPITSDIGLFLVELRARFPQVKLVAITGSNGKTTVTDALTSLGRHLGQKAYGIGNIGIPVLSMLNRLQAQDVLVVELSSYQLERVSNLGADVATLLNLSEDHLDRHGSMTMYWQAKQKVYEGAKAVVVNRDDPLSAPAAIHTENTTQAYCRFGTGAPDRDDFGLVHRQGEEWLAHGVSLLAPAKAFALRGKHNYSNVLAVLAIGEVLGWPVGQSVEFLKTYSGLHYRCQPEQTNDKIVWLNDSKGTNVQATLVALSTGFDYLSHTGGGLWWIGGGLAKGADFTELARYLQTKIQHKLRGCFLFGRDQESICGALKAFQVTPVLQAENLDLLFEQVKQKVQAGDVVVFSPACASMDQFRNFEERGARFSELVHSI